jgi:hypothetical protein
MPLKFEQQPRESNKAFAAFSLYLSLGPQRSTAAVAKRLAKSEQLIRRWSAKFDWAERVKAHDGHLAGIERRTAEALAVQAGTDWAKRQEVHREEEWQTRTELIGLAREAIARWKRQPHRCGTLEGIARLLDLASRLGRLSSGLTLEPEEKGQEPNVALMVQIEVALEKVYGTVSPPRRGDAETGGRGEVVDVEEAGSEDRMNRSDRREDGA